MKACNPLFGMWHRKVFGDMPMRGLLARKLSEECLEVSEELEVGEPEMTHVAAECADVLIVLLAIADREGFDLLWAARAKFGIVSARVDQLERNRARGII